MYRANGAEANSKSFAEGGPYRVEQPTAQQAPVVTPSQYKDHVTDANTRMRHNAGLDDFDSGAALFVGTNDTEHALTEYARRLQNLGQYMQPEAESQPAVFSNLEPAYRRFYEQRRTSNQYNLVLAARANAARLDRANAAGDAAAAVVAAGGGNAAQRGAARLGARAPILAAPPTAADQEVAEREVLEWVHTRAVEDVYANVRFIGFADTDMYMQNDHTRNGSGSRSVIVRASGDKTTCNTSWLFIGPAIHVAWFLPCDPALTGLHNATMYPWSRVPDAHTVRWRAILMPLTPQVFAADPSAILRVVGKCLKPSQPNRALTLLVSSQPIMPLGNVNNIYQAGVRHVRLAILEAGAAAPAAAAAPVVPLGVNPAAAVYIAGNPEDYDEKEAAADNGAGFDERKYAAPQAAAPAAQDAEELMDDQAIAYDDAEDDSMLMPPPSAGGRRKRKGK